MKLGGLGWVGLILPFPLVTTKGTKSCFLPKSFCDYSANDSGRVFQEKMETRKYHLSQYHLMISNDYPP